MTLKKQIKWIPSNVHIPVAPNPVEIPIVTLDKGFLSWKSSIRSLNPEFMCPTIMLPSFQLITNSLNSLQSSIFPAYWSRHGPCTRVLKQEFELLQPPRTISMGLRLLGFSNICASLQAWTLKARWVDSWLGIPNFVRYQYW